MGERRMMANSVIESNAMLRLSNDVQLLYLRLLNHADDDGMIGSPLFITRGLGLTEECLKDLVRAGFLIEFESGVVAILHWHVHNLIRKDRRRPTIFQTEWLQLGVDIDQKYYLKASANQLPAIHHQMPAAAGKVPVQDKTIEDNLIKDNLIESNRIEDNETDTEQEAQVSVCVESSSDLSSSENDFLDSVLHLYQTYCTAMAPCYTLCDKTKQQILQLRAKGWKIPDFAGLFSQAKNYPFLQGDGKDGWKADITWLTKEDNINKVQNGAYQTYRKETPKNSVPCGARGELGAAELEAIQKLLREG